MRGEDCQIMRYIACDEPGCGAQIGVESTDLMGGSDDVVWLEWCSWSALKAQARSAGWRVPRAVADEHLCPKHRKDNP